MSYLETYNPQWPRWYLQLSEEIMRHVSVNVKLYHIGSTAIPHLMAKPCIDILAEVMDHKTALQMIQPLVDLGYEYRGAYGIEGRYYFAKSSPQKVHLHAFITGADEIDKHLHYVKVMSRNPEMVKLFSAIKQQIQHEYPSDKSRYQQQKGFFYERIFAKYPL